jgi:uncharacterized protein (TIGR03086 family)
VAWQAGIVVGGAGDATRRYVSCLACGAGRSGRARTSRDPVGFQNSATAIDLGFYAARSYSLMKPPRTGRRLIRSWKRSATGSRAGAGARWTPRSRLAHPAHAAVVELAAAWRDPAAGEGMTEAGGLRMPADVMGAVALDQLVLHGWDLAGATSQSFTCDPASTAAVLAFTGVSARPLGTGCSARWPMTGNAPTLDRALG